MLVVVVKSNGMVGDMCDSYWFDDVIYWFCICCFDVCGCCYYVDVGVIGDNVCIVIGCFFVLGFLYDGVVYCGDDFDDM